MPTKVPLDRLDPALHDRRDFGSVVAGAMNMNWMIMVAVEVGHADRLEERAGVVVSLMA